jgi:eukaryotic-like serine/threonine-protein kinase
VNELRQRVGEATRRLEALGDQLRLRASEIGLAEVTPDIDAFLAAGRDLAELLDEASDPYTSRSSSSTGSPSYEGLSTRSMELLATEETTFGEGSEEWSLLVVEDEDVIRAYLAERLREAGFQVSEAGDGAEALQLLEDGVYDLILLDVMMPEVSGLDLLQALREEYSAADLPVIMVTGLGSSEDMVHALRLGANDYVTKPLDMPVVLARLQAQLSLKHARDQVKRLNRGLREAQARISRLTTTSGKAIEDLAAWSTGVGRELTDALGCAAISVWTLEEHGVRSLTEPSYPGPEPAELETIVRSGEIVEHPDYLALPVQGLTGEPFGAVVVSDPCTPHPESAVRVLESFVHQLGGALELKRARRQLVRARARQRAEQQQFLDRGIDLLRLCPECGRCFDHNATLCDVDAARLDEILPTPYRIADRYRLCRLLGTGAAGKVYLARDERLTREVAVKVIAPDRADDEKFRLRFEREARAVARIGHPGVVGVFDSGETPDGSLFIVMERIRGGNLRQHLVTAGAGTPAQVAALLRQGAAALDAAHGAGILHRDVKPANIILAPSRRGFRIKIVDFGVAMEVTTNTRLTQTGLVVGTPLYMSPEQLQGRTVDARSDLYSFAAVAFQALCGRRVTIKESLADLAIDIIHKKPPRVSGLRPSMPRAINRAFSRGLAKSPADRPASVGEWAGSFVDLLETVEDAVPGWTFEDATDCGRRDV